MTRNGTFNVALFFCQRLDPEQDMNRRALEKELGPRIRFYPLPCSGRIDALHLLRALETGADKVFLVTCPIGTCRYQEGNIRARKRVEFAQGLIEEVGFERERLEMVAASWPVPTSIAEIARELINREMTLPLSPLHTDQVEGVRTGSI
jgi:F420-non-reducing hydrogenase iron-sulfur subunit